VQQPLGVLDPKKWDDGRPCVVVGGGPSLIPWKQKLWNLYQKYWVVAVNDSCWNTYFPDAIVTLDHTWVAKNLEKFSDGFKQFPGPVIAAVDESNPRLPSENLTYLHRLHRSGLNDHARLSENPKELINGMNSGHAGLQVAYLKGAKEIYLLGFDFKEIDDKAHFHSSYPWHNRSSSRHLYLRWAEAFKWTVPQLTAAKVQVFNGSPDSALTVFPHKPYEEIFSPWL
jgi:hypothetical protein